MSSDRDDRRMIWVEIFDSGKYFFVWLDLSRDLSRDFWGYSKQSKDTW